VVRRFRRFGEVTVVDHHAAGDVWSVVNTLANLMIVAGYLLVPFTVLRYMPLTRRVRVAGSLFFVTCAITHLSMAFGFSDARWMLVNHVVQAFAVVWFVLAFWLLLRFAMRRGKELRGEP
jgi:hypothetical protein